MKPLSSVFLLSVALCLASQLLGWSHSATTPAPRGDKWWQDRQKSLNQRVAEVGKKAEVIFIGDSITQGWEGAGKDVWARYYASRQAINLGIGGDRTQHVLWRLDNGNLAGLDPKAAVVMIGTNNSNGYDNTAGQIVEGVTAIVEKLRAELPNMKILLVAIFPRGENYNDQRGKLLQVNQVLRRLADDENVIWVDFGQRFVDADGLIPATLMPDYLHLSPTGYEIWAESIEPQLAALLGDGSAARSSNGANLTGDWTWTMSGPDGNPVEAAMMLKADGNRITGRFARGENRWLSIEKGKLEGNRVSWVVTRDRGDGSKMSYRMSGEVVDGKITGQVSADMNGQEVVMPWSAVKD